ncbi:hypothetical protein AMATHDRAFT_6386 [Amanita thiersii Skay4041]|uniref:HD/PDEase domain-containing protein n=1 Tax=Amanita thiersii Skay4041 TaxID=703135 RepID=A0A2A9NJH8_9AGAR|nr:hypothetical protein AMATHDRAFT_6386 [Amanita thiersii Skay4041]
MFPQTCAEVPESVIDPPVVVVVARTIKDPIHDCIPISAKLKSFIDTPQYQRLRNIKQLGVSYTVWPGASHNRFEHGLGVAYLGRLMATHLQKNQPELKITDRDVECVEIAGLCHDLGHGPWSHFWDGMFIPRIMKGTKWAHEHASEMMFDYLVTDNDIQIPDDDVRFIKALIAGDPRKCSSPREKPFFFDIIANKRNGLDVDKFDYIQRDSYMIGEPTRISLQRMIHSARVLNNQICYDIKDANQIYEICATRFKLHKIVYSHKAAKAIEHMLLDALISANSYLHFAEHLNNPRKYLHTTDALAQQIEASEAPELEEARDIFGRIRTRDLYKCVDYKVIDWPNRQMFKDKISPESIVEAAKKTARDLSRDMGNKTDTDDDNTASETESTVLPDVDGLSPDDVVVDFSTMHYGMQEKNPLDFVEFYSKRKPNVSSKAGRGDYSTLMPQYFAEVLLRVYTKKPEFFGIVQAGYRAVLETLNDDNTAYLDAFPLSFEPKSITPPDTEGPTTPRVLSRVSSFTFGTGSGTFSNNNFTTVPPSFVPPSPTRGFRRTRSRKRLREVSAPDTTSEKQVDESPVKKKLKE